MATVGEIQNLLVAERDWLLKRVGQQREAEAEALEKAARC